MDSRYEAPDMRVLGLVSELTRMPAPPGKTGTVHDSSAFLSNFSCVSGPGSCGGH